MDQPVRVELRALSRADARGALPWRRAVGPTLRTPYELTELQQDQWYETVVCNRQSRARYWGLWAPHRWAASSTAALPPTHVCVGIGGLIHISWENGSAEISLLLRPEQEFQRSGYGSAAVAALLDQAFLQMRLMTVWGECYEFNTVGVQFWQAQMDRLGDPGRTPSYRSFATWIPGRKFWDGRLWGSLGFTFVAPHVRVEPLTPRHAEGGEAAPGGGEARSDSLPTGDGGSSPPWTVTAPDAMNQRQEG